MKRIRNGLCALALAVMACLATASCSSCDRGGKDVVPQEVTTDTVGYDYDMVVAQDYDYIQSEYGRMFRFLEVDAEFNDLLSESDATVVNYIRTVFQVKDTCVIIEHPRFAYDSMPVVTKQCKLWVGCADMTAHPAVDFDSCMAIIQPYRKDLATRHLTFRRIVGPPFPLHGEYILGHGLLFVDSKTGEVRGVEDGGMSGWLE